MIPKPILSLGVHYKIIKNNKISVQLQSRYHTCLPAFCFLFFGFFLFYIFFLIKKKYILFFKIFYIIVYTPVLIELLVSLLMGTSLRIGL